MELVLAKVNATIEPFDLSNLEILYYDFILSEFSFKKSDSF